MQLLGERAPCVAQLAAPTPVKGRLVRAPSPAAATQAPSVQGSRQEESAGAGCATPAHHSTPGTTAVVLPQLRASWVATLERADGTREAVWRIKCAKRAAAEAAAGPG